MMVSGNFESFALYSFSFLGGLKISFTSLFGIGDYEVAISGDIDHSHVLDFKNLLTSLGLRLERLELALKMVSSYLPGT